jgi:hypothetical protein
MALQHDGRRGDATSSSLSMVPPLGAAGASLMEVSAFMTEQLKAQLVQQREHDKQQHGEMMRLVQESAEARLQAVQAESEAKVRTAAAEAATAAAAAEIKRMRDADGASKIAALQMRLEALHAAELLKEDELFSIEDKLADVIGTSAAAGEAEGGATDGAARRRGEAAEMVLLSEGIASDKMLARQLRRKFA